MEALIVKVTSESLLANIDAKENTTNAYLLITLLGMLRDKCEESKSSSISVPEQNVISAGCEFHFFSHATFTVGSSDSIGVKKLYIAIHSNLYFKSQGYRCSVSFAITDQRSIGFLQTVARRQREYPRASVRSVPFLWVSRNASAKNSNSDPKYHEPRTLSSRSFKLQISFSREHFLFQMLEVFE